MSVAMVNYQIFRQNYLKDTKLSERYKRCAWQQAAGIMKSFYANNRENKPI
jgi:hypothetical protein